MVATEASSGPRVASPGARREPRFDGLRGLMAFGVVVFHVAYEAGVSNHINDKGAGIWGFITEGLEVCLPPFFVLSGLLLYRSFARSILAGTPRPSAGRFLWGRVLRIIPGYWVLTAVALLIFNFFSIGSVWDVLKPVLLLHFLFTVDPANWLIGMEPTWTVPAEAFFYVSLPIMAVVVNRYARRAADTRTRMLRMLVPLAAIALIGHAWIAFAYLPATSAYVWYFNFWPFGYIGFFAAGMALATVSAYAEVSGTTPGLYRFVKKHPNLLWLGALVVFVVNVPKPFGEPGAGTWGAFGQELIMHTLLFAFAVLIVTPLTVPGARSRLIDATLTTPPVRYLGKISYGIYLWHVPFIHLWFKNASIFGVHPGTSQSFRGDVGFWPLLAYVMVGTVIVATASHYLIERPVQRLRGRRERAAREPGAALAPAEG
ncbi:acyltransferase family protein [Microbispora sp. ATCC PTA-5024]|uniref:acyltransferase family protein n=1 Tax=Microbispora sp. ATCC PTA-5024 TaxID=316330 RepID=UPI0007C69A56|nr:acyltransferase [Microbispora sp. ATCC PTA-5024]